MSIYRSGLIPTGGPGFDGGRRGFPSPDLVTNPIFRNPIRPYPISPSSALYFPFQDTVRKVFNPSSRFPEIYTTELTPVSTGHSDC
jgi:hypothetical protein